VHSPFIPTYDNNDDTSDPKTAHGFSYHNGPEWVWLYGFYIVAKINMERANLSKKRMMSLLQEHIKYIQNNEWSSLPEITNKNGEYNAFSCNAQAWSISSILMAVKHIETLEQ
jgi:glycogen debranching enzyme